MPTMTTWYDATAPYLRLELARAVWTAQEARRAPDRALADATARAYKRALTILLSSPEGASSPDGIADVETLPDGAVEATRTWLGLVKVNRDGVGHLVPMWEHLRFMEEDQQALVVAMAPGVADDQEHADLLAREAADAADAEDDGAPGEVPDDVDDATKAQDEAAMRSDENLRADEDEVAASQ